MNKKIILYFICLFIFIIILIKIFFIYQEEQDFKIKYITWEYESILSNEYIWKDPWVLHNYANTAFQSFSWSSFQDLSALEEAVGYYSWSLNIREHQVTRENYETSKALLELLNAQKEEQQEQKQEWEDQSWDWQDGTGSEWAQWESEQGSNQNPTVDSRGSEYLLGEDDAIEDLTQEEKQELQKAIDRLKKEQISNQRYYGKQPQDWNIQDVFDSFFGTVDRGWEKDW